MNSCLDCILLSSPYFSWRKINFWFVKRCYRFKIWPERSGL